MPQRTVLPNLFPGPRLSTGWLGLHKLLQTTKTPNMEGRCELGLQPFGLSLLLLSKLSATCLLALAVGPPAEAFVFCRADTRQQGG